MQSATILGSPATFELQREGSDETTYAEAGRLDYDFSSGIVEFSEDAVITEGGNQISSNYLLYNIVERRINAQSMGDDDEKVKPEVDDGKEEKKEEKDADEDVTDDDDKAVADTSSKAVNAATS